MIIIYEIGDYVQLEDDIYVPHDLANAEVKLVQKFPNKNWLVETEQNTRLIINEKWFYRYVTS